MGDEGREATFPGKTFTSAGVRPRAPAEPRARGGAASQTSVEEECRGKRDAGREEKLKSFLERPQIPA